MLVLLALLQVECLAEADSVGTEGNCGPRDFTLECCLKRFPGQWERCTGAPEAEQVVRSPSVGQKAGALVMAATVAVAMQPRINAAEHRGVELAADLLAKVERAIERCTREADQQVNDHHFQGRSPSAEICQQLKAGEQVTWAVYLGLFKHEQAWPCLRKALDLLLPGRYWLHPRFRLDDRTGQWEFLDKKRVEEIVAKQGWKGRREPSSPTSSCWMARASSSACTISSSPVRKAILPGGRGIAKDPGGIGFKESCTRMHSRSPLASSHLGRESSGNKKRYSPWDTLG